ncbi:MAG: hypothetical protein EHM33_06345, partial [Chloroflexi bacterium]
MSDENPNPNQYPLGEPSVLDYVKSLFRFGDGERIHLPSFVEEDARSTHSILTRPEELPVEAESPPLEQVQDQPSAFSLPPSTPSPWRSLLAFGLALIGQRTFEPPHTSIEIGIAFYIAAFLVLGWALSRGEWTLPSLAPTSDRTDPLTYRGLPLLIGLALGAAAFFTLNDNLFTKLNVTIWILSIVFLTWAFWLNKSSLQTTFRSLISFFQRDLWTINISRWTMLLIAATVLVFFFRFYQTASVPPEPFSDHAEKIFDVYDVSQGQTSIFFPRNTGRESFQMYWTLLTAKLFGTGLSFLSLKLGTAILGFLTLPFIYLL